MIKDYNKIMKNFNYIDSITIIDNTGKIVSQFRYNPRFSKAENEQDNLFAIGKNLLELIPTVTPDNSTLLKTINTGKIVYMDKQIAWDHKGRQLVSTTLNFPILSRGKIIGAIDISKDLTQIDNIDLTQKYYKIPEFKVNQKKTAKYSLDNIVTVNKKMNELKEIVRRISNTSSTIMIYGDTGTGKELFVQSVHNESYRKYKKFIPLNCAAIPENLLESMLFGTEKGSFTGAETKQGLFEKASGGTIYLDEINSMDKSLQAKLLRAIQEKIIYRVGGQNPIEIDARVIASSNIPPEKLLESNIIRKDLFYRLNVIQLVIPKLEDRREDIPILLDYFIEKYNKILNKKIKYVDDDVMELFLNYSWPGNVRELEHIIEGSMNTVINDRISINSLPVYLSNKKNSRDNFYVEDVSSLKDAVEEFEKKIIANTVKASKNNMSEVARKLKIPRTTLQYKLSKYNIEV